MHFRQKYFSLIICVQITFLFIFPDFSAAQDQVKESLFKEATILLQDAEKVEAKLYSPNYFRKGYELYTKANQDFRDGKKLENIRKRLQEASIIFKKSIETTRLSKISLEEMTLSRNAAIQQQSIEWAPELFQKSEDLFRKAAEKVENGKTNDARKIAIEGSRSYRETELNAVKNRILNETWKSLKSCEQEEAGKYAPLSLDQATTLATKAEAILDQDRYDQENASNVAEKAAYEARHALFLAGVIKKLQEEKEEMETYLIDIENQFQSIASALNLELEYDGGFQGPAFKVVGSILELNAKVKKQEDNIANLSLMSDKLTGELDNLKSGQLKELSGKLSELEKIVDAERAAKERFQRVRGYFSPNEAKVIKEEKNVIIRLYGINFQSGRAIILPNYFPLLTKVNKAIEEFPNSFVRIEGHTDSRGGNAVNEKLSTDRANSVVQYILANSNKDRSNITGIGYGEDRPIASNDTEEGRSLNRRIDVVIEPGNKK